MNNRGFTLIELSTVLVVVGVLAAILLPSLARARETARRSSCMNNLMNLSLALHMYADEHERTLPWSGGKDNAECLRVLHGDYLPEMDSFRCPSDANDWKSSSSRRSGGAEEPRPPLKTKLDGEYSLRASYDYFGAYTRAPIVLPPAPRGIPKIPVFWDLVALLADGGVMVDGFNHIPGGANVLFLDGSIAFVHARDFRKGGIPADPQGIPFDPQEPPKEDEDNQR